MAIAVKDNQTSAVAEAHYTFASKPELALMTMNMAPMGSEYGKYVDFYAMTMVDNKPSMGAMICYTIDGTTEPSLEDYYAQIDADGPIYYVTGNDDNPFPVIRLTADATTLKVIGYVVDGDALVASDVETYTLTAKDVETPVLNPASGEVDGTVEITNAEEYAMILYTLNGSVPAVSRLQTDDENVHVYEDGIEITGNVTVNVIGYTAEGSGMGTQDWFGSDMVTASYTTTVEAPEVTITFDPANGAEVEVGDTIKLTASDNTVSIHYMMFATAEQAEAAEWDWDNASTYGDGEDESKPVITAEKKALKVAYAEAGADDITNIFSYAAYRVKESETPVDPDKLAAPKFMTDAHGESLYANKTDKVRLVLEEYDGIDLYYAVIVEETEDNGGFKKSGADELTFVEYDENLISLSESGDALNVTIKAFALKDEKSSDTVEVTYMIVDNINAYLVFPSNTGKNYPLGFTVYSENYEDIMEKDFMVYYTLDGKTEPSMDGYYNQKGDTIKYTAQIQQEDHLELAYCELTQDTMVKAKAYVMLDADAKVVLEVAVESHRVTVHSMDALTFSMSDTVEYTDTIKVAINLPEEVTEAQIYYTLDGSEPLFGRLMNQQELAETVIFEYWEGDTIKIAKNTTVKAVAYKREGSGPAAMTYGSDIAIARYKFQTELTFNPASGSTVEEGTKVSIIADNDVDIFYMMFESEEAAKAAEWNQDEAELYSSELQPVLSKKYNTIKAAYAHQGAEAVENTYFYATYTITERPAITLTLNPAAGSEVKDSTKVTVTASRDLKEDEFIVFKMFADKMAADTCADDVMVMEGLFYSEELDPEDETIGYPVITKDAPVLKVGTLNGMDEEGNWIYNWIVAEYKVKEQSGDSTAIEANELAGVSIYPNPTDGEFSVVAPANAQVEIFNAAGVLVKRMVVAEGMAQVRLNNSGIYFVRVRANGQMAVKKVVVR